MEAREIEFNGSKFDKNGYDQDGYNVRGLDKRGFNREGYNLKGFDRDGYNKYGFDGKGYDKEHNYWITYALGIPAGKVKIINGYLCDSKGVYHKCKKCGEKFHTRFHYDTGSKKWMVKHHPLCYKCYTVEKG